MTLVRSFGDNYLPLICWRRQEISSFSCILYIENWSILKLDPEIFSGAFHQIPLKMYVCKYLIGDNRPEYQKIRKIIAWMTELWSAKIFWTLINIIVIFDSNSKQSAYRVSWIRTIDLNGVQFTSCIKN